MKKITFYLVFFIGITLNAQVGIGNTDPKTELDIEGAISLRDGGTISLVDGTNSNVTLPLVGGVLYSHYRITGPTAYFEIESIIPVTGSDGQMVTLQNTTTQIMGIIHNNGGPAANRILIPSEQDLFLTGRYSSITLMYSDAQNRWIVQNKLNDITAWYYPATNILSGNTYNLTLTVPGCTSFSSVSVSLIGDWGTSPSDDITIHHVEARTGEVTFVVSNNTSGFFGTDYIGMDFIVTVIN
ncbi:hypothetical protein [Psychroserpens sp.]|uniref:hypothetical protein n=1 Tax=Psychroserpens sp. TaxID=2020870 RepID=UPI00385DB2A4